MINEKIDFVIQRASLIEWQKWLNQWMHTYSNIEIISSVIHDNNEVTIILKRTK
jgi:hypothetical protein